MNKKTLGDAIRRAREALGMTQRELGVAVGVEASHIAYLENGRRGPSLPLIRRIADTLGLDRRELFLLSHPDAKYLVYDAVEASGKRDDAWRRFVSNRALLRRHHVTKAELRILKEVSLVEHVSYPSHFLFILNSIRQAGVREN